MGPESEERPQYAVCYSTGNETEILDVEKRRRERKFDVFLPALLAYLLVWQSWLVSSQGMPNAIGAWDYRMSDEKGWRRSV